MELVGYEDVEARSHEALASLVVHGENNIKINYWIIRAKTIMQIQNDLQSRLEGLV